MRLNEKAGKVVAAGLLTAAVALTAAGCSGGGNGEPSMQTAEQAAALLDSRGFDSSAAETCYTDKGEYFDGITIGQGIEGAHPYYMLYYTDSDNDTWMVYDMGGRMVARPFGTGTWLTEHDNVTDYDSSANEFFELSDEDDSVTIVKMDKVTAEALDAFEIE